LRWVLARSPRIASHSLWAGRWRHLEGTLRVWTASSTQLNRTSRFWFSLITSSFRSSDERTVPTHLVKVGTV
jgi:hypothetical protein